MRKYLVKQSTAYISIPLFQPAVSFEAFSKDLVGFFLFFGGDLGKGGEERRGGGGVDYIRSDLFFNWSIDLIFGVDKISASYLRIMHSERYLFSFRGKSRI